MKTYYVYAYLREVDSTPYYIGKGYGNRAYSKEHNVSVPKDKTKIVFLKENIIDAEAINLEIELIAKYGRKDLGTGILRNKTDGGDGVSGYKHTSEACAKISAAKKGKTAHNKGKPGKPVSEETRAKMSAARKGKPGIPNSAETRAKMSAARKGKVKPKIACPHCATIGGSNAMTRYHFNNCKKKEIIYEN